MTKIDRSPFGALPDVGAMRVKKVFKALDIADSTAIKIGPNTSVYSHVTLKEIGAKMVSEDV